VVDVNLNRWRKLTYHDPAEKLRRLRALARELATVQMDDDVRALRTPELNRYREWRDAALFTYGMGLALGVRMGYATEATGDYDFVAAWVERDTALFCPVQLKELVAAERNPGATVDGCPCERASGSRPYRRSMSPSDARTGPAARPFT
jgi:hypothetical protein